MSLFERVADNREQTSISARLRKRRLELFTGMLERTPRPLTILDLGGTAGSWQTPGFASDGVKIVLMNVTAEAVEDPRFESIAGDARDLRTFRDASVDIVYSNSVIEHVGDLSDQQRMAAEVRRVAKRYFVQTPNAYFPIEPHFLVPGFQFMPLALRAFLLTKFRLGWHEREPNRARAMQSVSSVRLLTPAEFRRLFPEATFYEERFCGLVKSFVAYHGWS